MLRTPRKMFENLNFDKEAKNEFMPKRIRPVKGKGDEIVQKDNLSETSSRRSRDNVSETSSSRRSSLYLDKPVYIERRFSQSHFSDVLSNRAKRLAAENCFLSKHMFTCIQSPWSLENPNFNEPGFYEFKSEMLHYYPYHGTLSCRTALATFVTKYFRASEILDPQKLLLILGTCSALDILAHLTADPGDVYLCPSPAYSRIKADVFERSLVDVVDIVLTSKDLNENQEPFSLTLERVKETYENAIDRGDNVKGIILLNPNNPLGSISSKKELMPIFEFASNKGLYVIVDEIYALTIHDEDSQFESVLSYWDELPNSELVFWMWGFSKDFCNPGWRSSLMYVEKPSVLVGAKKLITYQCVPSMMHLMIEKFVSNEDWLEQVYFPTNLARVRFNFGILYCWLKRMEINFYPPKAGLFVFIDLRPYMLVQNFADERRLFDNFFHNGVYIVPGRELFCDEPGWFRIIFTGKPDALKEGLRRLEAVLSASDE